MHKTVCRRCLLAIYYQFGDGVLAARFVSIVVQTAARFRAQLWPVLQCADHVLRHQLTPCNGVCSAIMAGAVLLAVELHITTFDVGGAATSWVTGCTATASSVLQLVLIGCMSRHLLLLCNNGGRRAAGCGASYHHV